jgi:hypothetical protein
MDSRHKRCTGGHERAWSRHRHLAAQEARLHLALRARQHRRRDRRQQRHHAWRQSHGAARSNPLRLRGRRRRRRPGQCCRMPLAASLTGRGSVVRARQAIELLRDLGHPAPASSSGHKHLANVLRLGGRRQGLAILRDKRPVSRRVHGRRLKAEERGAAKSFCDRPGAGGCVVIRRTATTGTPSHVAWAASGSHPLRIHPSRSPRALHVERGLGRSLPGFAGSVRNLVCQSYRITPQPGGTPSQQVIESGRGRPVSFL